MDGGGYFYVFSRHDDAWRRHVISPERRLIRARMLTQFCPDWIHILNYLNDLFFFHDRIHCVFCEIRAHYAHGR